MMSHWYWSGVFLIGRTLVDLPVFPLSLLNFCYKKNISDIKVLKYKYFIVLYAQSIIGATEKRREKLCCREVSLFKDMRFCFETLRRQMKQASSHREQKI